MPDQMNDAWHTGRVAVVTGGNRGIGRAIARRLAAQGAAVAVGARACRDEAVAQAVCADVGCRLAGTLDVCDPASVDAFMAEVTGTLGAPDVLVNAAGISVHQQIAAHDEAAWQAVIDTNLSGPFRMVRAAMPTMIARGWGRIVNIASTAATTAQPGHAAYCASKAGLLGLTRAAALEGAPHGVGVVAVSPTWVETDMLRASAAEHAAAAGTTQEQEVAALAQANPQGRLVQPNEIAALVSFLCSDLSPALTMEDIQVNAGAHW